MLNIYVFLILFNRKLYLLDHVSQGFVGFYFAGYFFAGMKYRGVIPVSKEFSYFRKRKICQVTAYIHGDLPWKREISGTFGRFHIGLLDTEVLAYMLLNELRRDRTVLGREYVLQYFF